jgi:GNAT superfamily N-acetyltransferase
VSIHISELAPGALDRVERLWIGVHRHHQLIAPTLAPYVDDETTWRVRRTVYEHALAEGGFALVATRNGRDVGYALARTRRPPWPATFRTSDTIAELESLAVADTERGRGVGTGLLDAVDARLDDRGLHDRMLGAVATNDRAVALYTRRGYRATWITATRFQHRAPPPTTPPGVEAVTPDDVEALKPLALELHRHHRRVAAHLAPFLDDDASWQIVRAQLAHAAEHEILLRTGPADAPTALAWVSISRDDPLWADTWPVRRDVAELHLLVVAPHARRQGLGSTLLDAIDQRLAEHGVHDQVIGTITANADALRLCRDRGFQPTWLELTYRSPGG